MTIKPYSDQYFMKQAYQLAQTAQKAGEIPVGAVVVTGNQVIGKGYNQTEQLKDSTAHAEMIALTSAFQFLGAKYLHDCRLYVTLEPCVMCAGALHWSQIDKITYGTTDLKKGYSLYKSEKGESILHPRTEVSIGLMEDECRILIEDFFKKLRDI